MGVGRVAEGPGELVERLVRVTNEHDLAALGACFASDYRLEMPAHPARDFVGRDQVLRNWEQIFAGVPDITVDARWVAQSDVAWSEWEMRGTRRDGAAHLMRGVIIFRVRHGEFSSARLYLEPVEQAGADVDENIRQTVGGGTAKGTRR